MTSDTKPKLTPGLAVLWEAEVFAFAVLEDVPSLDDFQRADLLDALRERLTPIVESWGLPVPRFTPEELGIEPLAPEQEAA